MDRLESGSTARRYRPEVLAAGGRTVVPRWSADPVKGVAAYEVALEKRLLSASDGTAALLAVHGKVLAALSGEAEVTTGWVEEGRLLPGRLTNNWDQLWSAGGAPASSRNVGERNNDRADGIQAC